MEVQKPLIILRFMNTNLDFFIVKLNFLKGDFPKSIVFIVFIWKQYFIFIVKINIPDNLLFQNPGIYCHYCDPALRFPK